MLRAGLHLMEKADWVEAQASREAELHRVLERLTPEDRR